VLLRLLSYLKLTEEWFEPFEDSEPSALERFLDFFSSIDLEEFQILFLVDFECIEATLSLLFFLTGIYR
jgi:hypothetical protein